MKTIRRAGAIIAAALFALSLGSCARRLLGYSAMKLAGGEQPQYWAGKLEDEFEISFAALADDWHDGDMDLIGSGIYQGDEPADNFGYSVYRLRLPDSGDEIEARIKASSAWRALPDAGLERTLKEHRIKTFALFSGKEYSPPARGYFCPVHYGDEIRNEFPEFADRHLLVIGVWDSDDSTFYYVSIESTWAQTSE